MNELPIDRSSTQPSVVTTIERRVILISSVIVALCIVDGLVTALAR
jgi:hypothetical protein